MHALTGCDIVSSFAGKGKKKALQLVKDDQIARETVQILGETIPLGEHDIIKLEKVVCKLYNQHQCDRVDELNCKIFCKGKNVQSHQLPPTRASLENHLKRANYQARISIVTIAIAICSVNANIKCNKYEVVKKQYKFLPIFDWHLQSYLFCNNTEVHKTKNAPHPPPVKNALLSP